MELCGNIRVHCRIRPIIEMDRQANDTSEVVKCLNAYELETPAIGHAGSYLRFEFDHVFAPTSQAFEITNETAPLMTSLLDGSVNVCRS